MNQTLEPSSSVRLTYLEPSKEEKKQKKCFWEKMQKQIEARGEKAKDNVNKIKA